MTGLPHQSLVVGDGDPCYQPLRLSTVIHAPLDRVTAVLDRRDEVATLLDNGWLSLTVVNLERDHAAFYYDSELTWSPAQSDD